MWVEASSYLRSKLKKRYDFLRGLLNATVISFYVVFVGLFLVSLFLLSIGFLVVISVLSVGLFFLWKYVLKFIDKIENTPVQTNDGVLINKEISYKRVNSTKRKKVYVFTVDIEGSEYDIIVPVSDYLDYEVGAHVPLICYGEDLEDPNYFRIMDWRV